MLREAPGGHSQDTVARQLQVRIPRAISLEGIARVMEGVAVELDDQPPVGPHGVDLEAGDDDVHGRRRQTGFPAEVEEPALEL
jgi:hypothetical protein